MDSAILSLLGAFLLSIIGLLVENPKAASIIFARGELGKLNDPALNDAARGSMQAAATEPEDATHPADPKHAPQIRCCPAYPFGAQFELHIGIRQGALAV